MVNSVHQAAAADLQAGLPAAVDVDVLTDRTDTIRASVADVEFELLLAVVLVVLVIFLFLRNLPATFIPSLSVPLSIVGTFGGRCICWAISLNNLSLMALTISTGFVVDDAIVMIENIARYIEEGETPMEAALKGAGEIGFTIMSLTVSLIAVLIPLLFMREVVGRLFREFAVTLAVTILISAVVSLTLVPMLCARLLRHRPDSERGRFDLAAERVFNRLIAAYDRALDWVLGSPAADPDGRGGNAGADRLALSSIIPKGFFPVQDTGFIQAITEAGPQPCRSRRWSRRQQANWREVLLKDKDVVVCQLLHRRGRHQHDPEQRPLPDQPEAAGPARRRHRRDHPPPQPGDGQAWSGIALSAAGAGPDHRFQRHPRAVSVRAAGRQPALFDRMGARS